MKRIQLEPVLPSRANQVEQEVLATVVGDQQLDRLGGPGGAGGANHAGAAQVESVILAPSSQPSHLEQSLATSSSHVSTSQCLTNMLDCTCDRRNLEKETVPEQAEVPQNSPVSQMFDFPDFPDSPPGMKEVQDAVQVILERDLITLEEDISSLEKVLHEEVTVNTEQGLEKRLKSSNQQEQAKNRLETAAREEFQNPNGSRYEDVSENTRAHGSKRGRDQYEQNSESEESSSVGGRVDQDPAGNRLKCEVCGNISLKTQSQLENHVAGHLRADIAKSCSNLMRGLQCTLCGLEAKTRNQLVTHIGCKHGRVKLFHLDNLFISKLCFR